MAGQGLSCRKSKAEMAGGFQACQGLDADTSTAQSRLNYEHPGLWPADFAAASRFFVVLNRILGLEGLRGQTALPNSDIWVGFQSPECDQPDGCFRLFPPA